MNDHPKTVFTLELEAFPKSSTWRADPAVRLKLLLKFALRRLGLKARRVRPGVMEDPPPPPSGHSGSPTTL